MKKRLAIEVEWKIIIHHTGKISLELRFSKLFWNHCRTVSTRRRDGTRASSTTDSPCRMRDWWDHSFLPLWYPFVFHKQLQGGRVTGKSILSGSIFCALLIGELTSLCIEATGNVRTETYLKCVCSNDRKDIEWAISNRRNMTKQISRYQKCLGFSSTRRNSWDHRAYFVVIFRYAVGTTCR